MTAWVVFNIVAAYLLGSISSAILLSWALKSQDIREQGSGNPGATNVLRIHGKSAAAVVFLFDLLKGAIPVYCGYLLGFEPLVLGLVAISACLGHMYPLYFGFKGGKAVATALGAMMPIAWTLALALFATWILVFVTARISSLAAIITLLLAPLYTYLIKSQYTLAVALLSLLIIGKHRKNIVRLFKREEHAFRRNQ